MRSFKAKSLYSFTLVFLVFVLAGILFFGTTRVESQFNPPHEDAPTAIATACAGLITSCARNPSVCGPPITPQGVLVDVYEQAVEDIMLLNLETSPNDVALARGILSEALLMAIGRNPSIQDELIEIEELCLEDIASL